MHPFDEMKAYIGFSDEDAALLRDMSPHVVPHLVELTDHFYEVVLRFPGAARVLVDPDRVTRLKHTLQRWAAELLNGPHDHAYYDRRLKIGEVHVRVGLPQHYMFTAMSVARSDIVEIYEREAGPLSTAHHKALCRVTDLELAIMLESFGVASRELEMKVLRDLLVSHLPINALLVDAEGRVVAATGLAHHQYEGRSGGDIVGEHFSTVLPPRLVEAVDLRGCVERALTGGTEIVIPRVDVPLEQGQASLLVSVVPIDHAVARGLIHIEDLTEAISHEARARQTEALAHIGTMAARVAHEIRNPLAGMSGTMQVLVGTLPNEDRRRAIIGKVLDQIDRLNTMVGDLLQFSKPVKAQCGDVDLRKAALHVASQVASANLGRTEVDGVGQCRADPELLFQALLNLVQNSWQAGAGQVRVEVGACEVSVYDDGPGLDAAEIERVFQPFYTTRHRGTGLGLPNSRRSIEAMGGTLAPAPSPLGGAGFTIRLPEAFGASDRTSPSGSAAHSG